MLPKFERIKVASSKKVTSSEFRGNNLIKKINIQRIRLSIMKVTHPEFVNSNRFHLTLMKQ